MNATVSGRPLRRRLAVPITAALAALLLAGCAAGNSGGSEQGASDSAPQGAAQRDEGGGGVAADAEPDGSSELDADPGAGERAVVYTASMTVEVEDLDGAAAEAKQWTRGAGGFVASEYVSGADSESPTVRLSLKVPAEEYEQALEEFAELGERIDLDRQAEDVTEEVADVESRITSAEASLERLLELLDEAETVDEVLSIEGQVSTRQADLESLQARQEVLAGLTSYSTVELAMALPDSAVPAADRDSPGFLGGLQAGWRALTTVADVVVVAFGWLLPFLVVLAALGLPVLWLRRRARARRAAAAQADPPRPTAVRAGGGDDDEGGDPAPGATPAARDD